MFYGLTNTKNFVCLIAMSKLFLQKAVEIAGSQAKLAEKIGANQQLVSYWLHGSVNGVPPRYALAIEKATDGAVKRGELRPDIWDDEPDQGAA